MAIGYGQSCRPRGYCGRRLIIHRQNWKSRLSNTRRSSRAFLYTVARLRVPQVSVPRPGIALRFAAAGSTRWWNPPRRTALTAPPPLRSCISACSGPNRADRWTRSPSRRQSADCRHPASSSTWFPVVRRSGQCKPSEEIRGDHTYLVLETRLGDTLLVFEQRLSFKEHP